MKAFQTYIELLDEEIEGIVAEQVKNGITRQEQYDLHVLLENRKHVMELIEEPAENGNASKTK